MQRVSSVTLLRLAQATLPYSHYSRLKKLARTSDFAHASIYSLRCFLEEEYHSIIADIRHARHNGYDIFLAERKLSVIPAKILLFCASGSPADFGQVLYHLSSVREELANASSL